MQDISNYMENTSPQASFLCDSLKDLTSFLSLKTQESMAVCSLSVL